MKIKEWNEEIKIDDITYPADQLNRKQDAELLTKILVRRSNANRTKTNKSSYVININAEWGAGKTYFVKRWAEDLKHEHPVVYIDAWSNDFMDSPIITVLAEIQEQLLKTVNQSCLSKEKKKRFKNIGISVLPKILAALVKRYGGFDIEDLFVDENSDTDTSSSTQNNKPLDLSAAMEAMTTQAFKEHNDYKKGVKELKGTIKELVKYSIEKPKGGLQAITRSYPAFIFIDELDRCRPTYAVEMLEAIKHIFDIEGLVIVVSTHTEELQHTIKALYGNDFNADNYLRRFFDTKYHLDVGISASLLEANCDFTVLDNQYLEQKSILLFPLLSQGDDIKRQLSSFIAEISNWQNLAPRSAIQLADRLLTSIELIGEEKTVDILVLLILLCLYMFNKPQYDYVCLIFKDNPFVINNRVTDLKLSAKELNLSGYLKEMINSAKLLGGSKQSPISDAYERQTLMKHFSEFSKMDLFTYLRSFQNVLKRGDNIKKTNYLNTFGYDGRGVISEPQLLEAHMTFSGVNSFTANDYLNLIGLTSKFADN
ncbi:P-loop NTPase fold protein [Pseudoalteromonas sp. TAB23]|uniref:KAP family P-loop NTPase fold protein n=1 Tax=Pseudoalteromonas sp. TAB23 TaxID=1938595 RepID=UPI0004060EC2|nr:P-loop NTPase fold protein [Pseudoalteromonas sp. TAB23]